MLVEPRPPDRVHAVAGLQQRPQPGTGAAAHQAEMSAMFARQQLDNGGGFAMPPHTQYDAVVGPFHGPTSLEDSGYTRSCYSLVIPGRCEASNPESRDSSMRNCASVVWSFGPSRNDGKNPCRAIRPGPPFSPPPNGSMPSAA